MLPYKNRYLCGYCGKYHKNGSKAQKKCEEDHDTEMSLKAADKAGDLDL